MILGESQQFASPEEALEHYGTKGMHWGERKARIRNLDGLVKADQPVTRTTKNGDVFTLSSRPPNAINKALAFSSKSYTNSYKNAASLDIRDKHGKKIGDASFWHDSKDPDSVYLNWIGVKRSARGQGYATAILHAAEEHSRAAGKKQMKLEVPGNSPDARHIYEKMGFKVTKEPTPKEAKNDLWGGLTHMEKKLD